jgi:TRAP-type C4-dicarboxylate transport system substrate-binding protein
VRSLIALAVLASAAHADPQVLRIATVAPDGTAWARDLKAFGHDVEQATQGRLRIKMIFGGIAGDEDELRGRMQRGQLDGAASGGLLCAELAPSMNVMGVFGVLQERREAMFVVSKLKTVMDAEMAQHGFTNLGMVGMGSIMVFSRNPVRTMAEMRSQKLWVWSAANESWRAQWGVLGFKTVPLPLPQGGRAYQEGRIDGFLTTPTAALAYQWSAATKYLSTLHVGFLTGCLVLANRALDPLPMDMQKAIRDAAAVLQQRFEESGRSADEALLGGLFQKQGITVIPASDSFRAEYLEAARYMRDKVDEKAVPHELLTRVLAWLADFRAEQIR